MAQIITPDEASARIAAQGVAAPSSETVSLEAALGRRIADEVRAVEPWPSTDRSAMDGFAFATGGAGVRAGADFPVVGAALAGHPFDRALEPGEAVRIMTGGVVPSGADTVVMVEETSGYEGERVEVSADVAAGANIRRLGSEIAVGDLLIHRGARIRAAEIGALAALGRTEVEVFRRPRVAVLSTGDEVVPIEREPAPHQVRNSNAWALGAQIESAGAESIQLGIAADTPEDLRARLEDGLARADVVLTIGGVSKGTHDLVHGTLHELGVEEVFHGISLKPGKPLFFGRRGDADAFVFGLPGNPASTFTTFDMFVKPLVDRLAGAPAPGGRPRLPLTEDSGFKRNWRTQVIPARFAVESDGGLRIRVHAMRPSGDPFGLCGADGYAIVEGDVDPGDCRDAGFAAFDPPPPAERS